MDNQETLTTLTTNDHRTRINKTKKFNTTQKMEKCGLGTSISHEQTNIERKMVIID
jgi:hypothetical protein